MKFRTTIQCKESSTKIDHNSQIVLLGSCFSTHITKKFDYFKFDSFSNPFGILFNPMALAKAVEHCTLRKSYEQKDLLKHGENWLSLDHHSSFNQRDKKLLLININDQIDAGNKSILNATHVFITLGTAWIYKWHKDQRIVGNCHKIPQKYFTKELLSSDEITSSLKSIVSSIKGINKDATVVFTVSPVRHLKDGFVENTLSKSLLIQGIHKVLHETGSSYFPAYEIMMDDLRDYRFYKSDLIHPNEMAIDYIWEIFKATWIDSNAKQLMQDIDKIQKSLDHKPFDPGSESHKNFLEKIDLQILKLQQQLPQIKFHKKRK